MDNYWNSLSTTHRMKLKHLAKSKGVDTETAMRNIINYLKNDDLYPKRPVHFKEFITARQIESFIDTIFK